MGECATDSILCSRSYTRGSFGGPARVRWQLGGWLARDRGANELLLLYYAGQTEKKEKICVCWTLCGVDFISGRNCWPVTRDCVVTLVLLFPSIPRKRIFFFSLYFVVLVSLPFFLPVYTPTRKWTNFVKFDDLFVFEFEKSILTNKNKTLSVSFSSLRW
jgi:hypothetical protein